MARTVRGGLIQVKCDVSLEGTTADVKQRMIDKTLPLVEEAGKRGVQVLCLQELFYGPYFCAEQKTKWYELTEEIPQRPDDEAVPGGREAATAWSSWCRFTKSRTPASTTTPRRSSTPAAPISASTASITSRRSPRASGRSTTSAPATPATRCSRPRSARSGVYICYDRHFPEGARILGLNGAEIVFNPSATVAGLSEYLWKLEQPAHAVANGYFVGAINRVGTEAPWNIGEFYGQSYFCDPRGRFVAEASRDKTELVVADLNLDLIKEVRDTWQFYRDRRPETYGPITSL